MQVCFFDYIIQKAEVFLNCTIVSFAQFRGKTLTFIEFLSIISPYNEEVCVLFAREGEKDMGIRFNRFGLQVDCSRNAVFSLDGAKRLMDLLAGMGYNTLMIYIEDTYEIEDQPYFGYDRGRYSQRELRELDEYAKSKGIELIPAIQALAHIHHIFKWGSVYGKLRDCNDILMIGDEKVYELIDKMFDALSKSFTSRVIGAGMDEAQMLGRGQYYDKNGNADQKEILFQHIERVSEIAKKYGFELLVASDTYYRLASGGGYYCPEVEVSDELRAMIPDNVTLVYWDYYSSDREHYDGMFASHKKFKDKIFFQSVGGCCSGNSPINGWAMKNMGPGIESAVANKIEDMVICCWNDDGADNSVFAAMPSLFYGSQLAKGISDFDTIKKNFEEFFGISWDNFMLLDLANEDKKSHETRMILYSDLFLCLPQSEIREGIGATYADFSRKLEGLVDNEEWGYLFETSRALCDILTIKADLPIRIREAYEKKNADEILGLVEVCKELSEKVTTYYEALKRQWHKERRAYGFEIFDIRLGGLKTRIEHCAEMLESFAKGELDKIEQLEEKVLPYAANVPYYDKIVTASDLYTYLYYN